ncbi:hypothetical protein DICPUDRAFT_74428 [Dictyostelium purpureum]|uniref:Uncharacterized protein n=1 Tax=Dictyostelium purpureum TaxID=5786 RepID=F0Z7Q2_DICPU|nr:uncharacterized protein DICPUDRAFT_74428 [Dictyostelium purpureum]EGC40055.1 hypothetical protein DICPUDRAFT_74428 [Dictyostelium purpureum]|eukprot:XP_003283404.1 hypothetical protein DICPUDRAFT_74428 [Dictyostelium purpureum]
MDQSFIGTNSLVSVLAGLVFIGTVIKVGISLQTYLIDVRCVLLLPTELGLREWREKYKVLSFAQFSLTVVTSALSFLTYFTVLFSDSGNTLKAQLWLLCCILMFSLLPYTVLVVVPINKRLNSKECEENLSLSAALLKKWGEVNKPRPFMLLLIMVIFYYVIFV